MYNLLLIFVEHRLRKVRNLSNHMDFSEKENYPSIRATLPRVKSNGEPLTL